MSEYRALRATHDGNTHKSADRIVGDPYGADDDDAADLVADLIAFHGHGVSDPLRTLIGADPGAARRAVVRHLGFPVLGATRPGLPGPCCGRPGPRVAATDCGACRATAAAVSGAAS